MLRTDNAVIMAAGTSSRFAPLSFERPKALIDVRGEILIERQILQLKEAGINDIFIVAGYKAEQFRYLTSKFGVTLIHNPDYMTRNNNSSIYAARDILRNSYVCSADNYFTVNPFTLENECSYYAAVYSEGATSEWCMNEDSNGFISSVTIGGSASWYMLGHTFWSESFTRAFLNILEEEYSRPETYSKLWEQIFSEHLDILKMKIRRYQSGIIFEFDSIDELRDFDASYRTDTRSAMIKDAARELHVHEADIVNISPLKGTGTSAEGFEFFCKGRRFRYLYGSGLVKTKGGKLNMNELVREIVPEDIAKIDELVVRYLSLTGGGYDVKRLGGMTNRSYHVTMKNGSDANEYLVRLPGEGTEEMINRSDERKSTELACRLGIDSELLYFGDDGTKIMRFISNPQYVNEEIMRREENIKKAAEIFRRLHTCGEDTGVRFDVFGMSELYEGIIRKNNVSLYDDYPEVRREVLNIKTEVDARGKTQLVPCHNDSLMGNWVLDPSGRLYLIDWEYSGMNTAMWDLSCLSIEAEYTAENDEVLLSSYYGRKAELSEKMRFTAAKIYVDYLWSLWGLTRVPFDGEFMQRYADGRYTRLKKNILEYRNLN